MISGWQDDAFVRELTESLGATDRPIRSHGTADSVRARSSSPGGRAARRTGRPPRR